MQWMNVQNQYKKLRKEVKSDNFCYYNVGRAITKCQAEEINFPILLSEYSNMQIIAVFYEFKFFLLIQILSFNSNMYDIKSIL